MSSIQHIVQALLGLSRNWTSSNLLVGLAIFVVVLNLKNVPLMWHLRVLSAHIYHTRWDKQTIITSPTHGGQSIFQPVTITSHSPLYECDINGHKSDSTYFSDLDVSRIHLISKLFKAAMNPSLLPKTTQSGSRVKPLNVLLGGTCCLFKKDIMPYAAYDVHSRILAWEGKWIYIVSHFVEVGARSKLQKHGNNTDKEVSQPCIFASAISRYVFKEGRKTIQTEDVLESLNLLPGGDASNQDEPTSESRSDRITDATWNGDRVESERVRGMKVARQFFALESLHDDLANTLSMESL